MFPADPDLRTPLRSFLLKFLRAAPAVMADCDLEFADQNIEHIAVQPENNLAGHFNLRADTPPSGV